MKLNTKKKNQRITERIRPKQANNSEILVNYILSADEIMILFTLVLLVFIQLSSAHSQHKQS